MIFAAFIVAASVASSASAFPTVGGQPIVTLPIVKNPNPFTFSSLVNERTLLLKNSAPAINEGALCFNFFRWVADRSTPHAD
jgi:hypothetical protein